jgi:light-harvesting complex 1 beta chain
MAAELEKQGGLTGLTENEAKEFHKIFVQSFIIFTAVAVVAHILAWAWRPWLPPAGGWQAASLDGVRDTVLQTLTYLV